MIKKLFRLIVTCIILVVVLVIVSPKARDYAKALLEENTSISFSNSEEVDSDVLEFLESVYPNEAFADGRYTDCITKRFADYSVQFDYEPLHQTQDAWCYVKPEPKFEKFGKYYKVTWHCTEEEDRTVILDLKKESGEWKIDNVGRVGEHGEADFDIDYGHQPVLVYDIEEYPEELLNKLKELYGKLPGEGQGLENIKEKAMDIVNKIKE